MDEQQVKPIGELLVSHGLMTPRQLDDALRQQRSTGEFLGAILVRVGLIAPQALLEVLSERYGMPHRSLHPDEVDWSAIQQFPASALRDNRCFPIQADARTVTVALANPLDMEAVSKLEQYAGTRRIRPVLVLPNELRAVLELYRRKVLESVTQRLQTDGRDTR